MPDFPPASPSRPLPPAESISRYRDALLRDAAPEELAHLGAALDPEEVAWLELFRAAQREPLPLDPAFVARLDQIVAAAPGPLPGDPDPAPRGPFRLTRSHAVHVPHPGLATPAPPPARPRFAPRQVVPQLATAALLLVLLLAGLYTFGPLRPQPSEPMLGAVGEPVQFEHLWKSTGETDTLKGAYGLGIDPEGNVWVAEGNTDRFQIIAPDGTYRETWGTPGSGEGQFEFLSTESAYGRAYGDVAFDADGNLYVADTGNFRVQKFAPDRTFLQAWGSNGEGDGQFLAPSSIAIGTNGVVYVGDEARADVQMFSPDGQHLGTITGTGAEGGEFSTPGGVTVDLAGDLWVADWGSLKIHHFTAAGDWLDTWGHSGSGEGALNNPNDVVVDDQGHVFVVSDFANKIDAFTPDGRFLATAGGYGSDPGEFSDPLGMALGADRVVYVSDNNGVQAFRLVPADDEQ
jgi:hypothetical protein